jgi:hypothetical protein
MGAVFRVFREDHPSLAKSYSRNAKFPLLFDDKGIIKE